MLEKSPHQQPNEGRRSFLKKVAGIATAGIVGATLGIKGNKYLEREKELNKTFEFFNGHEEDFMFANKATHQLLSEMELENIARVKLSGTGHPNERITILRDFLTKHINSSVGKKYPFRDLIIKEGAYTIDNLRMLNELSGIMAQQQPEQHPKGPENKA